MKDLFLLIHEIIIKMEIIQNMMKIWNSSINTFSKSLLNIKFNTNGYKLDYINNATVTINIQVYYEQLLNKTIKRINKIPIKYDLYISATSKEKKRVYRKL